MKQVVINLRPKAQAASLTDALVPRGIEVIEFPTLEIKPVSFCLPSKIDWIALTSANAFTHVKNKSIFEEPKIAVIGSSTAAVLEKSGVKVDFISKVAESQAFSREFVEYLNEKQPEARVLLLKGSSATNSFVEGFEQSGILCEQEVVYKVIQSTPALEQKNRALKFFKDKDVSLSICATSSFALRSFVEQLKKELPNVTQLPVYVIGPKTLETATALGFNECFQAEKANVESLASLF